MRKAYLALLTNNGWTFVKREQIIYCLSNGAYTQVYLAAGHSIIVSKNLKTVANVFENDERFVRIHNSHLINLDYVVYFKNNTCNYVKMKNGEELAVSRNRKKVFFEAFERV